MESNETILESLNEDTIELSIVIMDYRDEYDTFNVSSIQFSWDVVSLTDDYLDLKMIFD
jgi:hypothetical protein